MDGNGKLQDPATEAAVPEAEVADVEGSHKLIGILRAGDVNLEQSLSVATTARGGAQLNQSASVAVISGGDTSLHFSAAVAAPSLGDLHVDKSAVQWVVSAGDVGFDKSACAAVAAASVRVERSAVGVALAPRIEVGEGGRVLLGPLAAVALGIGLGIGLGAAALAGAGWAGLRFWKRRSGLDGGE